MKPYFLTFFFIAAVRLAFGQSAPVSISKPSLSFSDLGKWPSLSGIAVSNDGRYVRYSVNDPVTGRNNSFIRSVNTDWEINSGTGYVQFTEDSRMGLFKNEGDSLVIVHLNERSLQFIPRVYSYKLAKRGSYIGYLSKPGKQLTIAQPATNYTLSYDSVIDYFFNDSGTGLLFAGIQDNSPHLWLVDLPKGNRKLIWSGTAEEKIGRVVFSGDSRQLAFETVSQQGKMIWLYKNGSAAADNMSRVPIVDSSLSIEGLDGPGFNEDGTGIFIHVKGTNKVIQKEDFVNVDIWSSRDSRLKPEQSKKLSSLRGSMAILNQEQHTVIPIEKEDEKIISFSGSSVLLARTNGDINYDEWFWNKAVNSSLILFSQKDGSRKIIVDSMPALITTTAWFSPTGNFVLYYDPSTRNYFSYEVASGIRRNITKNIPAHWTRYDRRDVPMGKYMPVSSQIAGGIKNDKGILLYDQCDIFLADLKGKYSPVNLTNGYGQLHNIEFRVAMDDINQYDANDEIILSAFDRRSKKDGFYLLRLGKKDNPELLTMKPFLFKGSWEDERFTPVPPIKAKDSALYIVRRMSVEQAPNFFWTKDFRSFHPLTSVHPEKNYNWITSELINWKTLDGSISQGILYKPENFDPAKKYPIIFQYYERLSEGLHGYLTPEFSHGELNIPYFVSNGYLVFTPDIYYQTGHPGNSVVSTLVSAANFLEKRPYIDGKRMGIIGHSRGGWETNFLVTHTGKFGAAVSASGMSNYTNLYNGVRMLRSGTSRQIGFEMLFQRIGATLWQRPDLYIENSPIFKADKVTTPLLIMANKNDDDVPVDQGIEFFNALRRLGKTAWMLQYEGEKHMVFDKPAEDYTKRIKQFFDYYLKGEAPPSWMVEIIPAKLKGTSDWFELEPHRIVPKEGLLKKKAE